MTKKRTIMRNDMIKKKKYINPTVEVLEVRSDLMKMTGPASLPSQAGGAPKRRSPDVF